MMQVQNAEKDIDHQANLFPDNKSEKGQKMAEGCLSNIVKYALFLTNFLIFVSKSFIFFPCYLINESYIYLPGHFICNQ